MPVDWQSKVLSPLMAAFGQPISYYPVKDKYLENHKLTGVFDEAYTDINIVDGLSVTSVSPCIGLNLADLPFAPRQSIYDFLSIYLLLGNKKLAARKQPLAEIGLYFASPQA
jgi:hypothetical protein